MFENISNEKILITGGTGFLGRHMVEALILKGVFPTILARGAEHKISARSVKNPALIKIDLLDAAAVEIFLEKFRPAYIVHLAGITHAANQQTNELVENNFQATVNLLEAARTINVKRIIVTGTADEYGFQTAPQVETMPTNPISEYAVSKNKAVEYALALYKNYNTPIVVVRPFTIYGSGQPPKMFVSQAVECAVKGESFEMSHGTQKRDLLFITDFADAMIKVLEAENIEGEIFNVGSGRAIALRDLAEKIWAIAGADVNLLKIGARQTNQNELHDTEADITKIKKRLNWQPQISLEEGLASIINKAKNNFE
ncbi:MAG: NAD-dependent epimerase/dehydratase family protein [Pyrinomonadaceae bacterium]